VAGLIKAELLEGKKTGRWEVSAEVVGAPGPLESTGAQLIERAKLRGD
jgi:hypothetical protein